MVGVGRSGNLPALTSGDHSTPEVPMILRITAADAPPAPSNSRKVKGYVQAVLTRTALRQALEQQAANVQERLRGLTGGQQAEALRMLHEVQGG